MADYKLRWLPLQRKLAEGVTRMGEADSQERRRAAGKSSTDSAIRFGEAKTGIESALTQNSGSIGSSKAKLGITGTGTDEATSRGLGFVAADQAIDDAYLQGLGMITAMGRGESSGALQGMGNVAQMASRQAASDADISAQRRAGNAKLGGQVAGFGLAGGFAPLGYGVPATNDLPNVNGGNAMEKYFQLGTSGD